MGLGTLDNPPLATSTAGLLPTSQSHIFQARMERIAPVTCGLFPGPDGNLVEINGTVENVNGRTWVAGITNRIDAAGADSGLPGVGFEYCYLSNASATFAPSGFRPSAVAPTQDADGVWYLGGAGNAHNWRFVGWVQVVGGTSINDGDRERFVVNYYNRVKKRLYTNPAFNNNNAQTNYALASATWALIQATGYVEFISNGEDAVELHGVGQEGGVSISTVYGLGVSIDSATQPNAAVKGTVGALIPLAVSYRETPAVGLRTGRLLGMSDAGVNYVADLGRNGAAADVPCTMLVGSVMS